MMARTKRSRRSYGVSESGRSRGRVLPEPKTGLFQLEWRKNGRRVVRFVGAPTGQKVQFKSYLWDSQPKQRTTARAAT